jgi:hypothetical protein
MMLIICFQNLGLCGKNLAPVDALGKGFEIGRDSILEPRIVHHTQSPCQRTERVRGRDIERKIDKGCKRDRVREHLTNELRDNQARKAKRRKREREIDSESVPKARKPA